LHLTSGRYKGTLQTVSIDGGAEIPVMYPPYTVEIPVDSAGQHMVDLTLYGHRRNSFGAVHSTDSQDCWWSYAPKGWKTEGERWSYEYVLIEEGVMSAPEIAAKVTEECEGGKRDGS